MSLAYVLCCCCCCCFSFFCLCSVCVSFFISFSGFIFSNWFCDVEFCIFSLFFYFRLSIWNCVCCVLYFTFFWDLYTARFSFGFVLFTFWSTQGVYEVEHYTNKSRKQFNMLLERYWIYVEAQCVIVLHQKDRVEWRSVVATKIVSARESGKLPYASIGIEQWKYIRIP